MSEQIQVLHVDDEPDFTNLTATFLEREDDRFSVKTATNADEGLERLSENEYDCVVSDYEMPKKDGIEFLESVREEYPDLPFVLFTGKGSEEVASEAISAGVTDYLQKDSGTEQYELLANRISNATERYLAQREADWHKKVIESMGEGVYVADSDHILRFVNFRMRREVVPEEDLVGRPLSFLSDAQILTEKEVNEIKEGIDKVLAGETEEVRIELEPGLPESEQTELRLRQFRVNGEKLALGTTRDITEQKRREEELTRSRELLRHTEEIARTGGWEIDVETGEQRWTEGAYEIGDMPPDADFDPTLEKSLEFYHPDDRDDAKAAIENCVESGEPFEKEFRLMTAEDRLRWAKVAGEPVTENGEVTRVRGAIRDITEHKNREKELRELKERLDLAVEGAELGVRDWDVESGEITHNQRWAEVLDLEPEEGTTATESVMETVHPEDAAGLEELAEKAISGEIDSYNDEFRCETADGDWKWVRTIGHVVERDGNGEATRIVGVNIDIDERKRQKKELERYRTFVESSPDVITHVDEDATVLYESPAVEDVFGFRQNELTGENAFDYAHPDDRGRIAEKFYATLEDPETDSGKVEYRARCSDGEYVWTEAIGRDQRDTEAGGIVINQRDISKRKERERAVEQAHEQLRQVIDLIPDPIFAKSLDDEVLLSNEANAELHGMTPEELEGRQEREIEPEVENIDNFEKYREREKEVIETGDPITFQEELMDPDGETHVFETTRIPFETAGTEEDAVLGYARDITSLKEYEQELERSNEELDRFASVVSHDLRNPLSVAEGRLELAQEDCDSDQLDSVEGALERMDALIEDILTLAREGSDIGEMEVIETDEMLEECWENVETGNATVVNELEGKLEADPSRLKQLCENLVRNAIEHAGEGVTVTVGELEDGDGFYIADDGEGIPEEERDDVFDTGYSTSEDGTGFGLSIVEEIVTAHGWSIDVTESKDGGARFEISGVEMLETA
jgi:PAS domain S-box-containing protein